MAEHDEHVGTRPEPNAGGATPIAHNLRSATHEAETHEELPGIRISVRRHGDVAFLSLRGELDAYTSPRLDELCRELHTTGVHRLDVDLAGTTFMDSSGLRSLLTCHRRVVDSGGTMHLSDVSEPVRRLLGITGLSELFGVESGPAGPPTGSPAGTAAAVERDA